MFVCAVDKIVELRRLRVRGPAGHIPDGGGLPAAHTEPLRHRQAPGLAPDQDRRLQPPSTKSKTSEKSA